MMAMEALQYGAHMALFDAHTHWAKQVATQVHRGLPPSFDLDDLEQVALIELWKRTETWNSHCGVPFRGYAHVYVQNACLMGVRRKEYVERTREELVGDLPGGQRPDEQVERQEQLEQLGKAFRGLSPIHRRVIGLYFMQGVSLVGIASRLGRSVSEVGELKRAALLTLYGSLQGHYSGVRV